YTGIIQLERGPRKRYSFYLPRDSSEEFIYDTGIPENEKLNTCTDPDYNDYDDYWYFWNPTQKRCPLTQGTEFDLVEGEIEIIKNAPLSYPEYRRLVNPDNETILIYHSFGMDDP